MTAIMKLVLFALILLVASVLVYRQIYISRKITAAEGRVTHETNWPASPPADAILFGDSRIALWDPMPEYGGLTILNRGIGGETTAQMLRRYKADVIDAKPRIVVFQAGINDLVAAGLSSANREKFQRAVVANLRTMGEQAHRAGIRVVLIKVIPASDVPIWRWPLWSSRINQLIEKTNKELETIDNVELIDSSAVLLPDGAWKAEFIADELHMTASAYRALNRLIEPRLKLTMH